MSAVDKKNLPRKENQRKRKRKISKISEEDVSKAEALLLDVNRLPETKEDFEKLVFQSPVSSMAWLGYTAFHLAKGEVAAARSVMERALQRIPFTEEQEIRNIWFSYINLECTYGGSSSLDDILKRFMKHNDKFPALCHLLKVFEKCQKWEDAEKIGQTMIQKFKHMPEAWTSYGCFLYSTGRLEDGRSLLQQSEKYLDKQQHIMVTLQFTKAEFRNGSSEHGIAFLEKLVGTYPSRTDLWSVYVDALTKLGNSTQTRDLYERIFSLNLPEKKVKFLADKYRDFKNKLE